MFVNVLIGSVLQRRAAAEQDRAKWELIPTQGIYVPL